MNNKSQFFRTKKAIIKWLDHYQIENYTINDDLSVDVNGDADISHQNLTIIPVKLNNITGSFWCGDNHLTNLVGFPRIIGADFWCDDNELTSLSGSPTTVGGHFWCRNNKLKSLIGSPKSVGGDFNCISNELTNLKGSPVSIGGEFGCVGNNLISLVEIINCNFKEKFLFNIDKKNFQQKELIQVLEQYYNNDKARYVLTNSQFYDIIKPQIEKEILQQKLGVSKIKNKIKPYFI